MKFRRTTADDVDFIALVAELDAELAIRDGEDHAFYAQFNTLDSIRHVITAYVADAPVACGAIKVYDDTTMEIKRMYTVPQSRGHGIAAQILTALEKWAAELGYSTVILETGLNQPEAIRLYEKQGYQRIPNYGQYAGVETSLCFEKAVG